MYSICPVFLCIGYVGKRWSLHFSIFLFVMYIHRQRGYRIHPRHDSQNRSKNVQIWRFCGSSFWCLLQVQISSNNVCYTCWHLELQERFWVLNPLYCGWFRNPTLVEVGSLCRYLQGFIHPRWMFGISVCQDFLVSGNFFGIQSRHTLHQMPQFLKLQVFVLRKQILRAYRQLEVMVSAEKHHETGCFP